tara:strand:- start:206 stop:1513 length:1308 start_codon:yes stop_codon:yes gene_type:complete
MFSEFHNTSRTGKIRVWRIAVQGDRVITQFGAVGGKIQEVIDLGVGKNIGRSNEVTPEEDARNKADRLILSKTRKGYVEVGEAVPTAPNNGLTLPGMQDLPGSLCFYKPYNSLSPKMSDLILTGKAWLVRKYDGEMMILRKTLDGRCQIYSRRMLKHHHLEPDIPWTARFPDLVREVEENPNVPRGTLLLGEMVIGTGADDRWAVAKVLKSKTDKALAVQKERGPLHFMIWDVAWLGGEMCLGRIPVGERLEFAEDFVGDLIHTPEIFGQGRYETDLGEVQEMIKLHSWEGVVAIDPQSTYGDRAFNLRGKAERPRDACCKIKPVYEDDFVASWDPDNGIGSYGTGKYLGGLGSVELYQYNSRGELVYISDMGNGWTKDFILRNSSLDAWPKVVQVRYESRTYKSKGDKTDALQFPRFLMERTDKEEDECINPEL